MVYVYLILGLVLLGFGGDTLVRGAVNLAQKMKLSPLLIGIVLVGFGTSAPELVTSIMATFQTPPATGLAVGNVIGSNIANILLVLGLTAAISPVLVDKKSFKRDSMFLVLSSVALAMAILFGVINFWLAFAMVLTLLGYVTYSYIQEKKVKQSAQEDVYTGPIWRALLTTILGIGITIFGANLLVNSSIEVAKVFGVSDAIIGLTIVAVGTSLPELATSVMASIRHHNEIAFGNVIGSNIYNALFILGVVGLIKPIEIPMGMDLNYVLMAFATMALLLFGARGRISRVMGFVLLICYIGYLYWLI